MCRVEDADSVTVLRSGDKKARKEHSCSECHRPILPGEAYHYEATTFEGYFDTYKTCAHCMVARRWLTKNCGGFIYSQVIEEVREHGDEYPDLREPLHKMADHARAKWKLDGALMPVPELPPAISIHDH